MIPRKLDGLIDPYRARLDPVKVARMLFTRHRGRAHRVKHRDLCVLLFGKSALHGSAADNALRECLREMTEAGLAIGSEPGPEGGVYWIANEEERRGILRTLYSNVRAIQKRSQILEKASLEFREPPGQAKLFE